MPTRIRATVDPNGGRVEARTSGGQPIVMDADPPHGDDSAASPKEALLAALAGCTAIDVCSILRKKRQSASAYHIAVSGSSAQSHPRVFVAIEVEHHVRGDVTPEALRRAIELSATRYCPVNAMLSVVARVEHRYRLVGTDGGVHEAVVTVVGPNGSG